MNISELQRLSGRWSLVTGSHGHLGRVICETLASLGSNIIMVDLSSKFNSELVKKIESYNVACEFYGCDLEDLNARTSLIKEISLNHSQINCLVNNAAFVGDSKLQGWSVPLEEQSIEAWNRALQVNLTAPFHLSKGLQEKMSASDGASIINISSIYGEIAPDWSIYENTEMSNPAAYGVSKAGINYLTKWLASYLAPTIRVNAIILGGILRNQPNSFIEKYSNKTNLGRMGTEDDIIGAVLYLASDLSRYVTGTSIKIDGGFTN